ncbi:MAG: amylo-alpha-1,6-glucosidase [Candidatus Bathyarchaeota archaeon]|nr:amylo-alpha-1,6-glucosidase [Candidatus Bathyarchaeota archaeon]
MKLPAITYPKEALALFGEVIAKEWLITNGLGSYASSSVLGINTRKYHGLLVAALNPPGERTVCLAKMDEDILVGGSIIRLGSNEFQKTIYPDGYKQIDTFLLDPHPTYRYNAGNVSLQKTVFLPKLHNTAAIIYHAANHDDSEAKIRLYPMLTARYYHNVVDRHRNPLNFKQKTTTTSFQTTFTHPDATLQCRITEGKFVERLNWVDRLHYRDELSRGEADFDDCFQPGYFELDIGAGEEKKFAVSCAVGREANEAKANLDSAGDSFREVDALLYLELKAKEDLLSSFYRLHPTVPVSDWLNWMLLAADSFVVQDREGKKSVIAGYHWFELWGRDTFIALPGLLLVTGRFRDAKAILQTFMHYLKGGIIPNYVADKTSEPVYNTVDGTLWYINAVLQYLKYTGDFDWVKSELWTNLQSIIENHEHGTMFGIRLDDDGLLLHGPRLTWMDAFVDGEIITPRTGKAVEIQALWYNTLRTMELLADKFSEENLSEKYAAMAELTRKSFSAKFWNPKRSCLFDVLEPKGIDASMRPNQILSVSMDYSMLNQESSRQVVDAVNSELVTPFGLRTLSPEDPKFVGKCIGDRRSRDTAYHNGTIWPWLLGPYVTAYLKANNYTAEARKNALDNWVLPLFTVGVQQSGLGTINEIYDCDLPNVPRGCISQAWSVAEPLRAYIEDVLEVKPQKF